MPKNDALKGIGTLTVALKMIRTIEISVRKKHHGRERDLIGMMINHRETMVTFRAENLIDRFNSFDRFELNHRCRHDISMNEKRTDEGSRSLMVTNKADN